MSKSEKSVNSAFTEFILTTGLRHLILEKDNYGYKLAVKTEGALDYPFGYASRTPKQMIELMYFATQVHREVQYKNLSKLG